MPTRYAIPALIAGLSVAIGANAWNSPAAATLCVIGYMVGAVWLLVVIRDLRSSSRLGKVIVAVISLLIGAPAALILLFLIARNGGSAGPSGEILAGLIVFALVAPFVFEGVVGDGGSSQPGLRAALARYVPPLLLLAVSVGLIYWGGSLAYAGDQLATWIQYPALALYAAAALWWFERASRPARVSWWRLGLIWLPSLPLIAAFASALWTAARKDDIAVEAAAHAFIALLPAILGGAVAIARLLISEKRLARSE